MRTVDPEVADLVAAEERRQAEHIRLIASENYASRAVREASGSALTNKYSEGYPGKRYYEGNAVVDVVEELAVERARDAVRRRARQRAALLGLAREPRGLPRVLRAGRHDHGPRPARGRPPDARVERLDHRQVVQVPSHYGVRRDDRRIDLDEVRELALREQPQADLVRRHRVPALIDFAAFARDRRRGRRDPRGRHRAHRRASSRAARIRRRSARRRHHDDDPQDPARAARRDDHVQSASTPPRSTGPCSPGSRAARTTTRPRRSRSPRTRRRRRRSTTTRSAVVANAKALAEALLERGFGLVTGGTDNHLILIDLTPKDIAGSPPRRRSIGPASSATTTRSRSTRASRSTRRACALGTPAVTSRGMGPAEMARDRALDRRGRDGRRGGRRGRARAHPHRGAGAHGGVPDPRAVEPSLRVVEDDARAPSAARA